MSGNEVYVGRARWAREADKWALRFDPPLVVPAGLRSRGLLPPHPFGLGIDPAGDLPWHPVTITFTPAAEVPTHVR